MGEFFVVVIAHPLFLPVCFVLLCAAYWLLYWEDDGLQRWRRWISMLLRVAILNRDGGRRWWRKWISHEGRVSDWERLKTPRRVIYFRPKQTEAHQEVKDLFVAAAMEHPHIKRRIVSQILSRNAGNKETVDRRTQEWIELVFKADGLLIHRREPFLAGAWAQTKDSKCSKCVFGIERLFRRLGPWTWAAIGHEFVHVAQEVRTKALRKDWVRRRKVRMCPNKACSWRCVIGWSKCPVPRCANAPLRTLRGMLRYLTRFTKTQALALRRELLIEGEAHAAFFLWPVTFLGIFSVVQLGSRWFHLWVDTL